MAEDVEQPERFQWNVDPFDLLDAPERYRTLYAFSAATLNLATSLWTCASFLCQPGDVTRSRAQAILAEGRLGPIQSPKRDGVQALHHSMLASRELFLLTLDAEKVRTLIRKRSNRFPRFFLTRGEGRALAQSDFKQFIVGEVRQSAMSLIAGALQLREQAMGPYAPGTQLIPGDGDPLPGSPEDLNRQLLGGATPNRQEIVAWLAEHSDDYKVRFNLACYFSREILSSSDADDRTRMEWVTKSVDQLDAALTLCPLESRRAVAGQAIKDPALVGLRLEGSESFARTVSRVGVTPDAGTLQPSNDSNESVEAQILKPLVGDAELEHELSVDLNLMHRPTRPLRHSELLVPGNEFAQFVEMSIAQRPAGVFSQERDLLARLLFLPDWTGLPRAEPRPDNQGPSNDIQTPPTTPGEGSAR